MSRKYNDERDIVQYYCSMFVRAEALHNHAASNMDLKNDDERINDDIDKHWGLCCEIMMRLWEILCDVKRIDGQYPEDSAIREIDFKLANMCRFIFWFDGQGIYIGSKSIHVHYLSRGMFRDCKSLEQIEMLIMNSQHLNVTPPGGEY